ncbi:MAG: protein-L-isoaspartate O-methyltransferase [Candidatus Nanohaloarchaea archaeon]
METNKELIEYLKDTGRIKTERVEEAFKKVDRKDFIPSEKTKWSYKDQAIRIGDNSTISAPHMVAINTETLNVKESDEVLEIGSGSGYQLAILGYLAEKAVGVEINLELVNKSRERLKDIDNVEVIHGNGLSPVENVFDKILFSAAVESFKPAIEYVKEDGVILAPIIEGETQILKKWDSGTVEEISRVRFVEMKE